MPQPVPDPQSEPLDKIDLDLRGTVCPMAFVKLRLFADGRAPDTEFSVVYENTAANEPLIRSIEGVGHSVSTTKVITPESSSTKNELKIIIVRIGA